MKALVKRWIILGGAFLLLGIAGLFLPILQGILFLVIGLLILSSESEWAHRLVQRLRQRFPAAARAFDDGEERARRWLHRLRPGGKGGH